MTLRFIYLCLGVALTLVLTADVVRAKELPNILLILTDDLGYGDLACYNDQAKVATPNIDRLASEGILFNDAHSPSTVCTPTRYSILTGQMVFRLGYRGVFTGVGGPCLIKPERLTLAELLQKAGYATAMFGKWHIGLTAFDKEGKPIRNGGPEGIAKIDYSRPFVGGPVDQGFDEFYGTASCPTTDWFYAYIDGNEVPVPPTQKLDRKKLPRHPYGNDCRGGVVASNFNHEEVDLVFLRKSQEFLRRHTKKNPKLPFFLFHSTQAVHLPSFAAKQFQGKSGAGPHGDFLLEMDWVVGQLLTTLKEVGAAENTLVIFSSDNGPEVPTIVAMRRDHKHDGARPWRGVKRDNWEGGHRVPLIMQWPGKITPGTKSNETVCLTDFFATFAAITGQTYPKDAGEDSFNILPAMLSKTGKTENIRPYTLHQTISLALAIRQGKWKYLDHQGSGGNPYNAAKGFHGGLGQYTLPEKAPKAPGQLYDLAKDPGETTNLYFEQPEVTQKLKQLLETTKKSGRSAK